MLFRASSGSNKKMFSDLDSSWYTTLSKFKIQRWRLDFSELSMWIGITHSCLCQQNHKIPLNNVQSVSRINIRPTPLPRLRPAGPLPSCWSYIIMTGVVGFEMEKNNIKLQIPGCVQNVLLYYLWKVPEFPLSGTFFFSTKSKMATKRYVEGVIPEL